MQQWVESIGLFTCSQEHVTEALEHYRDLEQEPGDSATKQIGLEDKMADLSLASKLMSERIDQFVLTPPSQKVTLAPLPPDYRPIPCKPLFFDLALNHIEFPSQGGQEENPALNYKFHIILAAKLKDERITPEELDKKLNDDLDSNALDRFRRKEPHQRMKVDETLETARSKLKDRDSIYPMMYLLDRWSRVYGGPRNPDVLKKMFKRYPHIANFIDKLCDLSLSNVWSKCGKPRPMQLEINTKGEFFLLCRDCKGKPSKQKFQAKRVRSRGSYTKQYCPMKSITKKDIKSIISKMPPCPRKQSAYSARTKKHTIVVTSKEEEESDDHGAADNDENSNVEDSEDKGSDDDVADNDDDIFSGAPTPRQLQCLKGPSGEVVRIIDTVASKWEEVAIGLGYKGHMIKTIEKAAQNQPIKASRNMLLQWQEGQQDLRWPVTWATLIEVLRNDAALATLAEDVTKCLKSLD